MRYVTKVDTWLFCLLTGVVLYLTVLGVHDLWTKVEPAWVGWMLLGMAVFLAAVFYSMATYEITATEIVVRSWLYGFRYGAIPLATIEDVQPSRNPLSAPAWSLDRLCIHYRVGSKRRMALISPRERDAFLRELAQRAPHLYLQGERLLRKAPRTQ